VVIRSRKITMTKVAFTETSLDLALLSQIQKRVLILKNTTKKVLANPIKCFLTLLKMKVQNFIKSKKSIMQEILYKILKLLHSMISMMKSTKIKN
jgi:hypothetical protein